VLTKNNYQEIHRCLGVAKVIVVATHRRPDGDALGSLAAFSLIGLMAGWSLKLFGRPADVGRFDFLPLHNLETDCLKQVFDFDVAWLTLDCASVRRSELAERILERRRGDVFVDIDHHPTLESYADLSLRDISAVATCEVLYDYCKANKIAINSTLATCLLTGIVTDTGNFLYSATNAHTFQMASELLKLGARLDLIYEASWRTKRPAALRLWGLALSRLTVFDDLAMTYLLPEDLILASEVDPLEDLAGFLSGLAGVKAILLLKDEGLGEIKGSWRSVAPDFSVLALARVFGGGGHVKAAGFACNGKLLGDKEDLKVMTESGIRMATEMFMIDAKD